MVREGRYNAMDMRQGIPLDIPKGYVVLWHFTTQAAYNYKLRLQNGDSKEVYVEKERQSTSIEPIFSGVFQTKSDSTKLVVEITPNVAADFRFSDLTIEDGELITKSYTFMAEDGVDTDYNDLLLYITAWRTLGIY